MFGIHYLPSYDWIQGENIYRRILIMVAFRGPHLYMSWPWWLPSFQWSPFQEHVENYLGIEKFVDGSGVERRLRISAENGCRKLHCVLRDLSSLLQALGRLAAHFTGEHFVDRFSNALQIVSRYGVASIICLFSSEHLHSPQHFSYPLPPYNRGWRVTTENLNLIMWQMYFLWLYFHFVYLNVYLIRYIRAQLEF